MPELNRRSFLRTTAALAATAPLVLTSRKSSAAPLNINQGPFWNAGAFHASTIGNHYRGVNSVQDYHNLSILYSQMLNVWTSNKLDMILKPQYNTVTERMFNTLYIPIHSIGNSIRTYNPSVTDAMVTDSFNNLLAGSIINGVDHKVIVLNNIRANGIASYIQSGATMAGQTATRLGQPLPYYPGPGKANPYTPCQNSALGLFGLGTALIVITVMTDGLDLIVASGWAAVTYWGGVGAAGWSMVHEMMCTTPKE